MAKNLEVSLLLDFYGQMLTEKQREVAECYYNEDLSLAEIGQIFGITRQGARDSIKRAETQLVEYEQKLGLYRRFHLMDTGLEEIVRQATLLQEEGSHTASQELIDKFTGRIIQLAQSINN